MSICIPSGGMCSRLVKSCNAIETDHLLFLTLLRSPNLGKTMLDFLPRLLTILPFDLVLVWELAPASMSMAANISR